MTGTLEGLGWALAAFVGSHFFMSWTPVRRRLVGWWGLLPFQGVYSLVSLLTFAWIIVAYLGAPNVVVWEPHRAFQHIPLSVMPLAFIFVFAGYSIPNPSSILTRHQPDSVPGIIKVTRHPTMWGTALWGVLHVMANSSAAPMMLGGGMAFLAIVGAWHIEVRRADDPAWQNIKAQSSFFPFAGILGGRVRVSLSEIGWWRILGGLALYAVFITFHDALFGASPMPLE